jgi:NAD(P)-dependent dehydrogenase (short-subunit alcohol dehydrogenase family)
MQNHKSKTVLITGANTGMGLATAIALAKSGYGLILGCRQPALMQQAMATIRQQVPEAKIQGFELDLGDLASVRQFAATVQQQYESIDCLLLNAGVMNPPHAVTVDGFESQFQINYLGHFLLATLLLPVLLKNSHSKIISISSLSSEKGVVDSAEEFFSLAKIAANDYVPMKSYRESKLAQVLMTAELQRRYGDQGLVAAAIHPGIVNTDLFYRRTSPFKKALITPLVWLGYAIGKLKTPPQGAATAIQLVQADTFVGGRYWADGAERMANPLMHDEKLAKNLWDASEKIIARHPERSEGS